MLCKRCKAFIDDSCNFCPSCGKAVRWKDNQISKRANGNGCVFMRSNGSYTAIITVGYNTINGTKKRVTRSKSGFKTKKEALGYIAQLNEDKNKPKVKNYTFLQIYELWLPTHTASKSTVNCYKAAIKYFEQIYLLKFSDITIDDLQECVSECDKGKRTKENMKTVAGLIFKYAIPRGYQPQNLNLAQYLKSGTGEVGTRNEFTSEQIEIIKNNVGKVKYADFIYAMIYMGHRPNEFLSLEVSKYNSELKYFIGGGKTKAGTDRCVTVSPKIQNIVDKYTNEKTSGIVFTDETGCKISLEKFRDYFYIALDEMSIDNPINQETSVHQYTPYSCRHTFATLMDKVNASSKAKLDLMGHTSEEMLRHYQHPDVTELKKITDCL